MSRWLAKNSSFQDGCDSFGIFRRFGRVQARLLAIRQANIAELEKKLDSLDRSDEEGGKDTDWRLKNRYYREIEDDEKKLVENEIQEEFKEYGNNFFF